MRKPMTWRRALVSLGIGAVIGAGFSFWMLGMLGPKLAERGRRRAIIKAIKTDAAGGPPRALRVMTLSLDRQYQRNRPNANPFAVPAALFRGQEEDAGRLVREGIQREWYRHPTTLSTGLEARHVACKNEQDRGLSWLRVKSTLPVGLQPHARGPIQI